MLARDPSGIYRRVPKRCVALRSGKAMRQRNNLSESFPEALNLRSLLLPATGLMLFVAAAISLYVSIVKHDSP